MPQCLRNTAEERRQKHSRLRIRLRDWKHFIGETFSVGQEYPSMFQPRYSTSNRARESLIFLRFFHTFQRLLIVPRNTGSSGNQSDRPSDFSHIKRSRTGEQGLRALDPVDPRTGGIVPGSIPHAFGLKTSGRSRESLLFPFARRLGKIRASWETPVKNWKRDIGNVSGRDASSVALHENGTEKVVKTEFWYYFIKSHALNWNRLNVAWNVKIKRSHEMGDSVFRRYMFFFYSTDFF